MLPEAWELLYRLLAHVIGPVVVFVICMTLGAPWWASIILGLLLGTVVGSLMYIAAWHWLHYLNEKNQDL